MLCGTYFTLQQFDKPAPLLFHDAVACNAAAGINAQDFQCLYSRNKIRQGGYWLNFSITSSAMSKLA